MDTEPKDVIVLGSIRRGKKKFSNIQNETRISPEELNSILEQLENNGFISVEEKKGWFGKKIELKITGSQWKRICRRCSCHFFSQTKCRRRFSV